jgi:hypothetical protein
MDKDPTCDVMDFAFCLCIITSFELRVRPMLVDFSSTTPMDRPNRVCIQLAVESVIE